MERIPVSYVLVNGGHAFQALALADRIGETVQPIYIGFKGDRISYSKIRILGPYFEIFPSLWETRKKKGWELAQRIIPFVPAILQSMHILLKTRSKALISCGGGPSLAPIIAAWILRRKVIHIESLSRIESYSLTGRISYRLFADLFFVQWKEALKLYPKAIWAGRLF